MSYPVNHIRLVLAYGISLLLVLLLPLLLWKIAEPKPAAIIDWLDIVTEGTLFLMAMCWLMVILSARPSGRVTNLLIWGLSSYCLGCYLDLLDEVFIVGTLPAYNLFEKIPTPVGLLLLTVGLWLWRDEQALVNRQLQTREQFYRQHHLTDRLTLLNDANAFEHHLINRLSKGQQLGLIMLDIDHFQAINQSRGMREGDRLLSDVGQWISSEIRNHDLVCRYAGDRFVVLIVGAQPAFVSVMSEQLTQGIHKLGCSACSVSIFPPPTLINSLTEPAEQTNAVSLKSQAKAQAAILLQGLNDKMLAQKAKRGTNRQQSYASETIAP